MVAVIDTCSWKSFAQYYLPFDKNQVLYKLMEDKIKCGEIIVVEKVFYECKNQRITDDLAFIKPNVKTDSLIAPEPAKLMNEIDNRFAIGKQKNKLLKNENGQALWEAQKRHFIDSADFAMILYCLCNKELDIFGNNNITIITEETDISNDEKPFKKIPSICKLDGIDIPTMTMPELLGEFDIAIEYKV